MSEDIHPVGMEFERLEQELDELIELEQATLLRSLALPLGYEKSQALAEYSNAVAAVSAMQQRRGRFLLMTPEIEQMIDEEVHAARAERRKRNAS